MRPFLPLLSVGPLLLIGACAPTIQVSTPEPVKIDVTMRVDVHTKDDNVKSKSKNPEEDAPLASRRRARMGEIQDLKNSRFVGENRNGYLDIRQKPVGKLSTAEPYEEYVQRIVREENNDRRALYLQNAEKQGLPLEIIERENAKRWHDYSYPQEWLQNQDGSWYQK